MVFNLLVGEGIELFGEGIELLLFGWKKSGVKQKTSWGNGSLTHYLQRFLRSQVVVWDFIHQKNHEVPFFTLIRLWHQLAKGRFMTQQDEKNTPNSCSLRHGEHTVQHDPTTFSRLWRLVENGGFKILQPSKKWYGFQCWIHIDQIGGQNWCPEIFRVGNHDGIHPAKCHTGFGLWEIKSGVTTSGLLVHRKTWSCARYTRNC